MITIKTRGIVTPDHKLIIDIPLEIEPGEYHVEVIIENDPHARNRSPQPPLKLRAYPWN